MKLNKPLQALPIVLAVAATLLSGCSSDSVVEPTPVPEFNNQFVPKQLWSGSGGDVGKYYAPLIPVAVGETLYTADRDGKVRAMDSNSGKTLWQTDLAKSSLWKHRNAQLSGGVTAGEQQIYVASEKAVLYALDRQSGKLNWQITVQGEVNTPPTESDGVVLVHTANGFLQAFKSEDGSLLWETALDISTLSLRGESMPVVEHGGVIVGDDNGHVNAIFLHNGQLIWQQRISKPAGSNEIARLNDVDGAPLIVNNIAYISSYNGYVTAIALQTGQILWKQEISGVHTLAASNDRLIVVDQKDNVYALAIENGSILWQQDQLFNRHLTDPAVWQDYVVVGDSEGWVYWLDRNSGDFVAKKQFDSDGLLVRPVVVNQKLIVQTRNGNIYALSK